MEPIFIYFLKANGLLVTFFFAYYFLLRKETFFNKNRWFLILGLFASVLLPLITFTKTIWIEPSPVVNETFSDETIPYIFVNQIEEIPFDWNSFLIYAYILIALIFLAKMMIELFSFFRIIKFGNRTKSNETILIDTDQNTNPFSFFKYIVFNSQLFSEEELQHIISHENIHVKEKHSIDVLLGKVFCALFWINPIMWFYRKEMLQNLEYIADNKASSKAENRINYQKTLLKVVTNQHQLSITNQFYQSLIKKRIVMLNTNQSNQRKSWKYALILPVLSAFMLLFQVETVAQVKNVNAKKKEEKTIKTKIDTIYWSNDFKEEYESKAESNLSNSNERDYEFVITTFDIYDTNEMRFQMKNEIISKNEKALYLFNDKEISIKDAKNIKVEQISEITEILPNTKMITKYGEKGKNGVIKISSEIGKPNSERNRLYIINGKEYLQSEIPKGTTVEVDGAISELGKEEGIKKYGQKAKDGVLVFEGKSTFVNKEANVVQKNLKINFEKGKTYIIEGHKSTYKELKDKNLFIYTESKYSITEKDNVVTITGDIVEDAEMWNDIEVIDSNPKKINDAKYLTFDNGEKIIYYNETLKIPGQPATNVKDFKISINDSEINEKDFKSLMNMKFNRFVYWEKSKILKFYTNPLPNNKTFILSNGDGIVVIENNRIKIPEFPTTFLSKVSLYVNDQKIAESEFIKMNYDIIKSIKVINNKGTSKTFKPIKEIYFYTK